MNEWSEKQVVGEMGWPIQLSSAILNVCRVWKDGAVFY